jgi:tubulin polyglutamylase TTLL6/13
MYRSSKPTDLENSLCFQIFGFDIMLDYAAKPWLLEVNHSPSFCTDSPLDYTIKKNVLRDTLHMLNLSWRRKNKYFNQFRNEKEKRLIEMNKLNTKQRQTEKEKKRSKK